jgi:hypothetical protein
VNALDVAELHHALRRKPVEKLRRRARVGAARVRVADVGGEEFEEAIGSTGPDAATSAGALDEVMGGATWFITKASQGSKSNPAAFSSFTNLNFQPSAASISL